MYTLELPVVSVVRLVKVVVLGDVATFLLPVALVLVFGVNGVVTFGLLKLCMWTMVLTSCDVSWNTLGGCFVVVLGVNALGA